MLTPYLQREPKLWLLPLILHLQMCPRIHICYYKKVGMVTVKQTWLIRLHSRNWAVGDKCMTVDQ